MDSIFSLLNELEDMLETSKAVPFTSKVSIDKEKVFDIINDIRLNFPGELKQAQRVADNCDKIIKDANNKASLIVKDAEERAIRLAIDHEIVKMAKEQAENILEEAKNSARGMRIGAVEYADELLANAEQAIRETLEEFTKKANQVEDFLNEECNILYDNRQELRGND